MIRDYGDHAANERTFLAWLRTSIAVRTGRLLNDSSIHSPSILPDLVSSVVLASLLVALSAYLVLN